MNKAEEYIIQEILKQGHSDVYWDTDILYMESDYEAGKFLIETQNGNAEKSKNKLGFNKLNYSIEYY